jgi:hypothetical protein
MNARCDNPLDEIFNEDVLDPLLAIKIAFKYFAENAIGSISSLALH